MKKLHIFLFILLPLIGLMSCSKDNKDENAPSITPEASGTMTDVRDGATYHWVRYNGLDWTVENSRYNTGDANCAVYYTNKAIGQDDSSNDSLTVKNYGYLYNLKGAKAAVPDGWRLPTDEDYKKLEQALGMSSAEADADGWRGSYQATLLTQSEQGSQLAFKYGGLYDANSTSYSSSLHYLWQTAYGYYWSATEITDSGVAYFRKIQYNTGQVWRHTTDVNNMFSVRFVRDVK